MSWNCTYETIGADISYGLPDAAVEEITRLYPDAVDVAEEAYIAAVDLIEIGAVGALDRRYRITLSGHVNPNHEPREGFSNDFVQMTVSQC